MEANRNCSSLSSSSYLKMLIFFLFLFAGLSSSSFISGEGDIVGPQGSTGRNLLQAKKACPIKFESKNYTIITSECKGPPYAHQPCSNAYKKFACPYDKELKDLSNDCASTMNDYVNLHGKYPSGLFGVMCQEGKHGLKCPA